jgi:1,4-alpha-glucan branching enzyme
MVPTFKRAREGKGWEMSQIAVSGTILGRGIPMILMGQEAGEWMQFGQDDGKLQQYNPGTGDTWWDDCLDLEAYEKDAGRSRVRKWYRRMFEIRKEDPKSFAWPNIAVTHVHHDNGVFAFTREVVMWRRCCVVAGGPRCSCRRVTCERRLAASGRRGRSGTSPSPDSA